MRVEEENGGFRVPVTTNKRSTQGISEGYRLCTDFLNYISCLRNFTEDHVRYIPNCYSLLSDWRGSYSVQKFHIYVCPELININNTALHTAHQTCQQHLISWTFTWEKKFSISIPCFYLLSVYFNRVRNQAPNLVNGISAESDKKKNESPLSNHRLNIAQTRVLVEQQRR